MIGRITLPKTTGVSLNERFSQLRELRERQQQEARLQQPTSEASRQLAQQMETRPAVRAALTPTHLPPPPHQSAPAQSYQRNPSGLAPAPRSGPGAPPPPQKRLHVKQRLAIQARLGVLRGSGTTTRGGALAGRLGTARTPATVKRLQSTRGSGRAASNTASRTTRGRGRGTTFTGRNSTSTNRGGGATAGRGRGAGRGRAGSRGTARGAARGGAAAAAPKKVSKEDLDDQLDAYMASTKGHLDAELDAYMKEAEG